MSAYRPILIVAATLLLGGAQAIAAQSAYLHANIVVDGGSIRLGDVFDGAGEHANKVIAYAPAAGRKLILESVWLYRVARAYRVPWRPSSRLDRAIVERRSQIISTAQISEAVLAAVRTEANSNENLEIELDNRSLQLFLPVDSPPTLKTRSISYNSRTGRFSAIIIAPDDRPGARRVAVTGRAYKLVQVPTLATRAYPEDIIGAADILWKTMRVERLDKRTILDSSKLIGKSPRRPIVAGRPVKITEVQSPILVTRGKRVTIYLHTKRMQLSAMGRALQNGGLGDIVRVQNINSGKTIQAVVTGAERVTISSAGKLARR